MRKLEVKFDKPIYVGMCILDISKTYLYEFHHEYMLPLYREKCKIMYTDTDSILCCASGRGMGFLLGILTELKVGTHRSEDRRSLFCFLSLF